MSNSRIIITLPEQATDLTGLAEKAIRRASALGVLPTPIEDLIAAAKIKDKSDGGNVITEFIGTLKDSQKEFFKAIINKVRGIADYRESAIYVPSDKRPRVLFAKSHELAHHDIPWHKVHGTDGFLHDDKYTLSPDVKLLFEQEANYYAAEVIFQGRHFVNRAISFAPSFDTVFLLAGQHGASNQATLRRYVEVHDETLAAVTYLVSDRRSDPTTGLGLFNAPRLYASKKFLARYGDVDLPYSFTDDHPWAEARTSLAIPDGYIELCCSGSQVSFWWQAWWNGYALLVLLRRKPRLSILGDTIRSVTNRSRR